MKNGDSVDNFQIRLVNNLDFDLFRSLKHGPVVLNFIMGTWCPFCANHLKKIRKWQESFNNKATILIISAESSENLRAWLDQNPMSYLFASDEECEIIHRFGQKKVFMKMATPATYLIDRDKVIKMAFKGVRTDKAREEMKYTICKSMLKANPSDGSP
ncbi:redoxin domain-containing protein [Halobacteriovorax sp. GB3]|uniref:peroxiredoxin family protein n=1 Tax=Halobacteriovorax sp. GB3 TaxID=2719615 RepID=UPI002360BC9B|nr:redoxin domain-containing protein [Halobacteriovorax sp. GB3]MDD0852245.1 redoxin domain-containing protein [Halobacteriovorax sp. GB3]